MPELTTQMRIILMRYISTWPFIIKASLVLKWRGTMGQILLFILMGCLLMTSSAHARVAGESFADLAQKLLPSVVNISTTSVIKDPSVSPQIPQFPPGSPFEEFFRDFLELFSLLCDLGRLVLVDFFIQVGRCGQ